MLRNTRLLVALGSMLLCLQGAQAQDSMPSEVSAGPFTIGAHGGATMSWMSFKDSHLLVEFEFDSGLLGDIQMRDSRRFGGSIGLSVAYDVTSSWRLETRLLYATQGSVASTVCS